MANASILYGWAEDTVVNDWFNLAAATIYEQYGHRIRMGRKVVHKYGRATDVGTTEVSVNTLGVDEVFVTGNDIDTMSGNNALDNAIVGIEGLVLNADGTTSFLSQEATVNGQSKVLIGTPLFRVNRIWNTSAAETNGGVFVYEDTAITNGVPDDLTKVHGTMLQASQSTLKAGMSIETGTYFMITRWDSFVNRQQAANVDFRLKFNNFGSHLRTRVLSSGSNGGPQALVEFEPFLIVPPENDIVVTAESSSANTAVNSMFFGFYADIVN